MATMSVDALKNNLTNPARVYLWEVLFPNPVAGDPETLLLRCQTTSMPGRSFGRIHVPFKQSGGIEFPGKLTYSHNWELTFQEGSDREIFNAFYGWCQAVIHDKYNTGDLIIKRNILLHLIETDGSVSKKIRLIGCFPSEMRDVALDQNSEDALKFTIVFGYDRWEEAA